MTRKKNPTKMVNWTQKVEPELFAILKRKGRKAAAWVRSALWAAVNKEGR